MTLSFSNIGLYQKRRMWILTGMMMLVVIIPTACLLWFVSEAVRNERMAVRQKLTDMYKSQIENLPPLIQNYWKQKIDNISATSPGISQAERFKKMIEAGIADSIIIYGKEDDLLYPVEAEALLPDYGSLADKWKNAEYLEFREKSFLSAAGEYAEIEKASDNINISGMAFQGRLRCYIKAGKKDEALNLVSVNMDNSIDGARDKDGRLILPGMQLFAVQSADDSSSPLVQKVLKDLVARINDYSPPVMHSSHRLFFMKALKKMYSSIDFPTFEAERLASICVQSHELQKDRYGFFKISREGLWQAVSTDRTVVVVLKENRIKKETQGFINSNVLHTDARFLFTLKDAGRETRPLLRTDAGDYFPGWELVVQVEGDDLFMAASQRQISLYIWTALLIIAGILILAILTTRLFVRQMNIARIKNDLITTVSHELKTPLASTRLLADTIMDGRYRDEKLVKEYVELIAKENERLTRLVENFLTFSRIEDKRQTFNFKMVEPEKIVRSVYETTKHRFESGGFSFEMKVTEKIPAIVADHDAMVMVLLNLLDNSYHYSGKVKAVTLAAYAVNGDVCFEVGDKGIGLSQNQKKKILKPFYQVDQTLSRRGSGFGLGLSIVKSIVDVHHGSIDVKSELGKGSVFAIKIPEVN